MKPKETLKRIYYAIISGFINDIKIKWYIK